MTHEPVNEEYVAIFPPFDHSFSRKLEKRIANGEFNSVEEVIAVASYDQCDYRDNIINTIPTKIKLN